MKILMVDDSKFSQITTSKIMKEFFKDLEIIVANDGEEGYNKYKDIDPDYVFVDLLMPNVNGKELVKLIKEYDKDARIFIVSADVQESVKKEMELYGVLDFINKPFNKEKAESVLRIIKGDGNE